MAARTRKIMHDDETRSKIQAAQIINRFQDCLEGKITLDAQQVSCGKALLNKILPDLQAVTHDGELTVSPFQGLLDAIDGRAKSIPTAH